jgi:hypothetical protein
MKQITSLWLLVLFMASTTLIAQTTSTGLANKDRTAVEQFKMEQVQNQTSPRAEKTPMDVRTFTNSTDAQWDVLFTFSAQAPSSQAVVTDGNNFYMTYWNGTGLFDKFDMSGNYISSFTLPGGNAIRDLTYDGTYFYGAPNGGMSIAILDLANQTLVGTIPISSSAGVTGSRHLSYDPELDNGNGGFWLGQWGELAAVSMTGATLYSNSQTPTIASCYGSAYDNYSTPGAPKLWLFTQNAGASPNDLIMLQEFDINTRTLTGVSMDLFTLSGNFPGYIPGTAANQTIAGGAISYVNANNKFVLAVNIQQSPNLVVGLELADAGPPLTKDVGISAIPQPATGVNLTGAEPITITIRNYGTASQSNIPWTVNWNGPTGTGSANGTLAGPLAGGATADVTLTQTANLSTYGDYTFTACTALTGDENAANDCKNKTVINKLPEYCPASTTYEDEYIANVLCGTIDNSSGWQGGVADYTAISTAIGAGQSEAIVVTNGNPWASDLVTCWVDWNMSYTFDEGDEKFVLVSSGGGLTFTGAIAVPTGTPQGDYRMRVRMSYSTAPTPCGVMSYGEVEDYTIHVGEPATKDVGVTILNMGGFYEPGVVSPKATVKNFGSATQTFNVTLTIGSYTSTKSVAALVSGATQEVTFDNWNATVGSYTAEACTQLAGDENPANNCKSMGITVAEGNFVFAYNAYDASGALAEGPVTFDIINPGSMNLLAPTSSGEFIAGATWANGTWYGCMYTGGLYTIDTQTGAMVLVGPSADLSGLAFDGTTMYGASITALYSVDMATGASTMIGPMGNPSGLMIGIAADAAGNLFGYDIGDDIFYSINKTTGVATAIGSLGYDFNYAQDMAYDKVNDVCYIAGYTTTGALFSVDVTTGAATQLALFAGGAEITGFAIPSEGPPPPVGDPPVNFMASYVPGTGVQTSWDAPPPPVGSWVRWDGGENWGSLGLEEAGTFWCAARWEPTDLAAYDGQYLTQVEIFPVLYSDPPTMKLMIWEGAGAANLVYEQVLTGLTWDEFNTITLDEMHMIDASTELMVGFEIIQPLGEYPMGYDEGPAVAGKGDLVSLDGITFVSMSTEFEIDNNFNIGIYVAEEADGMVGTKQIIARNAISNPSATFVTQTQKVGGTNLADGRANPDGYNVYRNNVKVNTTMIPANVYAYTDVFSTPGTYTYFAKAVYPGGESAPSNQINVIISEGAPSLVFEPFEDYNANDYLVQQAVAMGRTYWTTWSNTPGTPEDPFVSSAQAYAGNNSVVSEGTNDPVLVLNQQYTEGVFHVEFYVYIPTGKIGYFNALQLFDGAASEWGMQAFFDVNGVGSVDAGGQGAGSFNYAYDTWHNVKLDIDLDNDFAEMFLNGTTVITWQWSKGALGSGTVNTFNAMNFFAWADTGTPGAYFDNIDIVKEGSVVTEPSISVNPMSLTELHPTSQITTKMLTVTNTGNAPLVWEAVANAPLKQASVPATDPVEDLRILQERMAAEGRQPVADIEPGVTGGVNQNNGNDYTKYATYHGNRMELYDNGPFVTAEGVGPGGTDYSELQDASLGMGTYGAGCQVSAGNSIADDFEVTETWNIDSFTFFSYQTGSGNTSTLNDVRVQIYDGDPSAGGTVIWGNLTTNLMTSTSWTNAYRVLESAPDVARPIMEIVADVTGLQLNPGTYWVEMMIGGTGASGPWAPAVTIVGQTTTGNSIQHTSTGWAPLLDVGPQGLPFVINGTGGVQATNDVGVSAIPQPVTGVNLTSTEAIAITIKNYGTASQSNIPWTVNWDGPTGAGSANGTFAGPIASGATATVNLTQTANLSTLGDYTFTACTALAGDENPANNCKDKMVSNNFPEYCGASTTYEDEFIQNVLCGMIDNTSGWQGGVADYTAIFTEIDAGASEAIVVTNGNPWASDLVTCWVDWDMSYTFDEGDEKFVLVSSGGGLTFTGAIAVPVGTPNGDYRMRIRMSYSTAPTPCGVMSYGEVEDYTIKVGGTPTAAWLSVPANTGGTLGIGESDNVPVTFNSNDLPDGTYNGTINFTSNDPNNPLVVVPATLTVGGGGISVNPMMLEETHANPPDQTTKDLTFLNSGDTPLDVTLSIDLGSTLAPALTINPETYAKMLAERQAAEGIVTSTGRAPYTEYIPTGGDLPLITLGRDMAFAYNAYDASGALVEGPITFDLASPGSLTQLAPTSSGDFIAGGDWADGVWYGCMYGGGLYTIDDASGAMTLVGSSPDLSGLAWDGTTMYGASITALYSIDLATGAGTMIGPMGNNALMIGIAANADGEIYGYDIGDDNFYHIDKTTGAATVVGSLGYDFNYAQDMAFDRDNDVCYLAGYTTTGALFSVNVATGAATQLGTFAGGAEVTGFAIPYTSGPLLTNDLSLSSIVSPNTGVNLTNSESVIIKIKNNGSAAQSNFPWTVTWDGPTGAGSANGTYSGSLAAGASVEVTAGTANLSTYGTYTFEACVNLAGDEKPDNNCKTKILFNEEPSLCWENLYSSGCSFGDGLIAWNLSNINVPNIPCSGTPPWYHDYRDMVHELVPGTYTLTVQAGYSSTYFDVWIDFNDDLVLSDNELVINDAVCTDANTVYTFQLTVPANAPGGDHVLRFRTNWTAPVTDPCATYSYGNCCDFKANTGQGTTTDWMWIAEGDLTFTLPANGGVKVVPVHFDSQGLSNGDYPGTINVVSNDPDNPLVEVDAILHVGPTDGLTVNPTEITETHSDAPEITTRMLDLINNTGAPVSWTLAIEAGVDAGALNLVPGFSAETPVYTGQIQVESEPGVIPGEMVEGPAYTTYASFNGTRGELYNNGGFVTAAGVGSNGTDYSELQDASLGMGTYGYGCQISAGNSMADDFVVTDNWTVESFTFFAYQTGSGTTSTLNDVRCQIYDGDPSAGGTVIYGNFTTNLMTSTSWTNAWRVLESGPTENRPIMQIVAGTPGLTLSPGTYWVETSFGGTGASGPWAPAITIVGQTTTGNALQKTSTGWAPAVDVGPQGLPFIINGTGEVAPWLTSDKYSGTLANGVTEPIELTFNSEGLDDGTYYGNITISSSQPDIVVPVTFIVESGGIVPGPTNLVANINDFFNVDLTWDAPAGGGFAPEWITYSGESITNSIGTNAAANFDVAARWTPADLSDFEGGAVTKVDFVPGEPGTTCTYTIKIWQGSGNPTLKYSQLVTTVTADVWNTVVLDDAYQIDLTQELWIGFNCNTTAGFPAGCDAGPQDEGFGNMMYWEGAWTTLSQLAPTLTFNWAVKGYIEPGLQVEGYNVYRKDGDAGSYILIGSTDMNTLNYFDESLDLGKYYYRVKAEYAAGLSVPSNTETILITSISDPSGAASALQIYPNPTKDQFTIKSESELQSVTMVNYSGQVIFSRKATGNELLINANEFAKGVYTLQIETKDGRSIHKVIIQ